MKFYTAVVAMFTIYKLSLTKAKFHLSYLLFSLSSQYLKLGCSLDIIFSRLSLLNTPETLVIRANRTQMMNA